MERNSPHKKRIVQHIELPLFLHVYENDRIIWKLINYESFPRMYIRNDFNVKLFMREQSLTIVMGYIANCIER